jgi:hypothetical protein
MPAQCQTLQQVGILLGGLETARECRSGQAGGRSAQRMGGRSATQRLSNQRLHAVVDQSAVVCHFRIPAPIPPLTPLRTLNLCCFCSSFFILIKSSDRSDSQDTAIELALSCLYLLAPLSVCHPILSRAVSIQSAYAGGYLLLVRSDDSAFMALVDWSVWRP